MKFTARYKRRIKRKTFSFVRPLIFILNTLLAVGFTYYIFIYSGIFKINNVEISGTGGFVSATDVKKLVQGRTYEKNIFLVNSSDLKQVLLETFQGARDLEVNKKFPKTLQVKVQEREPIAVVFNDPHELFLVDTDGYVLGLVEKGTTNLPKIEYKEDISVGYFLNKETLRVYFEVITATDSEKIEVEDITLNNDEVILFVKDSVEVKLGVDKDIRENIVVLSRLLEQLFSEGKEVKGVDLRYDKVIVSYD